MLPLVAVLCLAQQERTPSLTGHIEDIPAFTSKALSNTRKLHIYLPPDYGKDLRRRFPVLYLHDGQNVFDGATSFIPNQEWRCDEAAEALIGAGLIEPLIMVAIDNAGAERNNEYLWTKAKFRDMEMGGKGDAYTHMVVDEIKPMIDQRYRTKSRAADTALCGSSLGGLITYHMGVTYPQVFGKLAVVSPSIWWDNRLAVREVKAMKAKLPLKVWVDIGGREGTDGVEDAKAFRDALVAKGWTLGKDLIYYEDSNADHSEISWARRFPTILMYLFGK